MHERGRAKRRRPDEVCFEYRVETTVLAAPHASELHDQIVRMLVVDKGGAVISLAGLKHLRRAELFHRERFERRHALEREPARAQGTLAVEHEPVLRFERPEVGELAVLIVVSKEHARVPGPGPIAWRFALDVCVMSCGHILCGKFDW